MKDGALACGMPGGVMPLVVVSASHISFQFHLPTAFCMSMQKGSHVP